MQRLAEADTGVNPDALFVYTRSQGFVNPVPKVEYHFTQEVIVVRVLLHGARRALDVHEDQHGVVLGDNICYAWVVPQRRNVVDDVRARLQGGFGDGGAGGVYGDG